jgi:zinc transport system ATP-binding protein
MDGESETRLFETLGALKNSGAAVTILIVTHDRDFVSALTDRVLCMGDDRRGIVQHRIEASGGAQGARVLHEKAIPANECYEYE